VKQKYYTGHNLIVHSTFDNIFRLRNREIAEQWKKKMLTWVHFVHPVRMGKKLRRGFGFTDGQDSGI
jgi:hypothetical protein